MPVGGRLRGGGGYGVGGRVRGAGAARGGARGSAGNNGAGAGAASKALKLCYKGSEVAIENARLSVGRALDAAIRIDDAEISRNHFIVSNGFCSDNRSSNGTAVNGTKLLNGRRWKLQADDKVRIGTHELSVKAGSPAKDELSRSKRFPNMNTREIAEQMDEKRREDGMSCEQLMTSEFEKIIGHDKLKKQLWQFYKKVQLDEVRASNNRLPDTSRLFHMLFMGPPGTGKTTMANLVAKVMVKMKLIQNDKVVFVNNALELCAQYAGQTPKRVDDKVAEAKGGVLFIDEAYSIVKENDRDSFGKEAIETLMKHLDPPSCVFIFAGYEKPMNDFLRVNQGLERRIPYRYKFDGYDVASLVQIFAKMAESKGEKLASGVSDRLPALIESVAAHQRATQNAGMIMNWLSFAQIERDDRVDIDAATKNPALASLLLLVDLENGLVKVRQSAGSGAADDDEAI
jgi:stage V sporulation protein K